MKRSSLAGPAFLALALGLAACDDDSPPEPTLEERCAEADEAAGIVRPEGWAAISHCKLAPADVATVFPADKVGTLTIKMTAAEYALMQADLDELLSMGNPHGKAGPPPPENDCAGKAERAACQIDVGNGLEAGICVHWSDSGVLECYPDAWRAPVEWRQACEGRTEGDECDVGDFDSECRSDGIDLACFPPDGPQSPDDPCADKVDGATCEQGSRTGVCVKTTGLRVCQADGFDSAEGADNTPIEAAAQFWPREPKYFHADIEYAGARWTTVGIRYKGNNGLASSDGEKKPLRIKLDEWEDETKAVTDQRVFGFQDLSLSPNQTDGSMLHQVLATEAFRGAGGPAPYASFIEVYLDTGSGAPRLLGLYAVSELPDDQLPKRFFQSDDGNLYKPDGRGAHFAAFITGSLHKRNNETTGFDDVKAFVDALHAAQTDRPAWRAALNAVFDMKAFARTFAVNQAIANWDTYGALAHNFYLYNHAGQLSFIPWDFDLSFDSTGGSDLSLRAFGGEWPLLQALARDVELFTVYTDALGAFATAELASGKLAARADALATMIRPAVTREDAVREGVLVGFEDGVVRLKEHLTAQGTAISQFLTSQDPSAKPSFKRGLRESLRRGPDLAAKRRWQLRADRAIR
jgi:spore coat protein H